MISLIRSITKKIGFKQDNKPLIREPLPKFKKNIFNTDFNKTALVSFIVYPYLADTSKIFHTQVNECISLCEILNEFEYVVDLTDYNNYDDSCLQHEYQLVIGFGEPVEKILNNITRKNFLLISYRNGSDNVFSDKASLDRLYDFYKRTGLILTNSGRVNPESWRIQIKFADRIIALGNRVIKQTFEGHTTGRIDSVDLFYNDIGNIDLGKKDFSECRKHFLWFGSLGAIHKGLDLLLVFFSKRPGLELHIAGINQSEAEFIRYYKSIFDLPNIHNHGFLATDTSEFKDLIYKCGAIISPSASEGGGGAVLTILAAGGLIPIMTSNVGIDVNEMVPINGFTVEHIEEAVDHFCQLPVEKIKELSGNAMSYIREKHTLKNFKGRIKKIMEEEISQYESNNPR